MLNLTKNKIHRLIDRDDKYIYQKENSETKEEFGQKGH